MLLVTGSFPERFFRTLCEQLFLLVYPLPLLLLLGRSAVLEWRHCCSDIELGLKVRLRRADDYDGRRTAAPRKALYCTMHMNIFIYDGYEKAEQQKK